MKLSNAQQHEISRFFWWNYKIFRITHNKYFDQASSRSWANYSPTGICLGLWLFSKVQHKSEIVVWNFKSLEKFKFAISRFINLLQSLSFRLFPFLNGSIRRTKEK